MTWDTHLDPALVLLAGLSVVVLVLGISATLSTLIRGRRESRPTAQHPHHPHHEETHE